MLSQLKWVLFALIVLGTLAGLGFCQPGDWMKSLLILFLGLSLSIYAFLFVPRLKQFYLSELIVLVVMLGVEATVIGNVWRMTAPSDRLVMTCVFGEWVAPFIVYFLMNALRPKLAPRAREKQEQST